MSKWLLSPQHQRRLLYTLLDLSHGHESAQGWAGGGGGHRSGAGRGRGQWVRRREVLVEAGGVDLSHKRESAQGQGGSSRSEVPRGVGLGCHKG